MKIGIDISQVAYRGTGVGRFTDGLINAILDYDTENKWVFFFSSLRGKLDTEIEKKIKASPHKLIRIPLSPPMLSFLWNTLHIIPIETFTGPLDVFFCSDWTEPPSICKKATVIHDLAYIHHPETVHHTILETQKKRMYWVKKETDYIITPSVATQKDAATLLSIPESRITPLYSGVETQTPLKSTVDEAVKKYNLSRPFILSVGKLEPRKNISRLIDAFIKIKRDDWDLVIVGPKGWDETSNTKKQISVKFIGYVVENELHALYELCQFFVYPSLWEGFGYPVLEAMLHKKAVAASNTSSLLELVEHNGVLFNPLSTEEIAKSLVSLMDNGFLRTSYENKGFEFAHTFTWRRYFDNLMNLLHSK